MENWPINRFYDIAGFCPTIIPALSCVSWKLRSRLESQISPLYALIEEQSKTTVQIRESTFSESLKYIQYLKHSINNLALTHGTKITIYSLVDKKQESFDIRALVETPYTSKPFSLFYSPTEVLVVGGYAGGETNTVLQYNIHLKEG
jgi:hypothetical protein